MIKRSITDTVIQGDAKWAASGLPLAPISFRPKDGSHWKECREFEGSAGEDQELAPFLPQNARMTKSPENMPQYADQYRGDP